MTNKLLVVVLVLCVAAVVLSGLSFAKVNSQGATLEAQGEQLSSLVEGQAPANSVWNNIKCNGYNTIPWPGSKAACDADDDCFWKDWCCGK